MSQFAALGLKPSILDALDKVGYIKPTPIQAESIPPLLDGRDVLGQAQTGTGKTAAFALPTLQRIDPDGGLQMLILAPTRELAVQVSEAVYRYSSQLDFRILPIYGGQSYERQERRLNKGVHVVVGTPGRTLDLIKKRILDLRKVRFLVLDEADEMLKMGFIEDVEAIINATDATTRQTILFSATYTKGVTNLAQKYMRDPQIITIEEEEVSGSNIYQRYYVVQEKDKIIALSRLLETENPQSTLIFARTRIGAAELAEKLAQRSFPATAIHGDLSQNERERIIQRFRQGQTTILVATDVMARGVDIPDVSHVINYDIPQLPIEYVHRIGRTGRAGRRGDAITLLTKGQVRRLRLIEDYIEKPIEREELPSREDVIRNREQTFMAHLTKQLSTGADGYDDHIFDQLEAMGYTAEQIAVNAIKLLRENISQAPLEELSKPKKKEARRGSRGRDRDRSKSRDNGGRRRSRKSSPHSHEEGMVRLLMDIGRENGLKPGDVVYRVASSANISGREIGAIDIRPHETYLDVPEAHVDNVLKGMRDVTFHGRSMSISRAS